MRRYLLPLLLLIFFLVPTVSFAQTSSPTPTRKSEKIRVEKLKAVSEKRQVRITAFFEKMMKRFEAAIARLEKLIERIETRMDKIDYDDKSDLNEAKRKLSGTKVKIETLKTDFNNMLTSDTPKEVFKKLGQKVREIKKDLVEVHKILVHIIGNLKGLREPK